MSSQFKNTTYNIYVFERGVKQPRSREYTMEAHNPIAAQMEAEAEATARGWTSPLAIVTPKEEK